MKYGNTVRAKRLSLGLSQWELASAVGFTGSTIAKLENGELIPDKFMVKTINEYLRNKVNSMDEVQHCCTRTVQLALQLQAEDNIDDALLEVNHMLIELTRVQRELLNKKTGKRYAGECI